MIGWAGWLMLSLLLSSSSLNYAIMTTEVNTLNVLGTPLESCCLDPLTGWYRDGHCRTDQSDRGLHLICAQVTEEFLEYSRCQGNDLVTARANFPGLKAGDGWCLCVSRWLEALAAGVAPPIRLESTHVKALNYVSLEVLRAHAL